MNQGLAKAYTAGGAITPCRFIKFGSDDLTILQASAATDLVIGVSDYDREGTSASTGDTVDGILSGIVAVKYGGTITRGQLVMSDASGQAISATATAGSNVRTAGIAMVSGVSGDIGRVLLIPGSFQG